MKKDIFFAGGCFWGTEHIFKIIPGVLDTTVGYANGSMENPSYEDVCYKATGHRETVKVTYDDAKQLLSRLVQAFFMVIDPTVKNRQGNDMGSQYQTGVYYVDEEDLSVLENAFAKEKAKHNCVWLFGGWNSRPGHHFSQVHRIHIITFPQSGNVPFTV